MSKLPAPGDRIELTGMGLDPYSGLPDPCPLEPGSKGTVESVVALWGDTHQIRVNWDSGRGLMLVVPPDEFTILGKEDS